jgi:3-methyl-2-oxobutanoate hydroxymethyltransferase
MRNTIRDIWKMKAEGIHIPVLTCYDYTTARILDSAGVPVLLVGDSLGMVVHGHDTTLPVTLDMMLLHCAAVARGAAKALIVIDMPFATYGPSIPSESLRNAARALSEGGAQAVKIEGGARLAPLIEELVGAGIPVMGHLGLTPQSINQLGGYRVQARGPEDQDRLLKDAQALERAGAFAIVLELIPADLAANVTAAIKIPTIGIGAGPQCSGQVQVFHDVFGLYEDFVPKHTRRYASVAETIRGAARAYVEDVRAGRFPRSGESKGPAGA